jgi:hypothetical protein
MIEVRSGQTVPNDKRILERYNNSSYVMGHVSLSDEGLNVGKCKPLLSTDVYSLSTQGSLLELHC